MKVCGWGSDLQQFTESYYKGFPSGNNSYCCDVTRKKKRCLRLLRARTGEHFEAEMQRIEARLTGKLNTGLIPKTPIIVFFVLLPVWGKRESYSTSRPNRTHFKHRFKTAHGATCREQYTPSKPGDNHMMKQEIHLYNTVWPPEMMQWNCTSQQHPGVFLQLSRCKIMSKKSLKMTKRHNPLVFRIQFYSKSLMFPLKTSSMSLSTKACNQEQSCSLGVKDTVHQ